MIALISRLSTPIGATSLYRNRFYAGGLALQKGVAVLLIPLIVAVVGQHAFSEYVLFYTVVQIFAAVAAFGLPQSFVPLWYRQEKQDVFLLTVLVMMIGFWVVVAVPAALFLSLVVAPRFLEASTAVLIVSALIFALVYNLNALATALARARGSQRQFFWSVAMGAFTLALGLGAMYLLDGRSLADLIIVQVLAVAVSVVCLFSTGGLSLAPAAWRGWNWRPLLKASMPLYLNTFSVMYVLSVDKWAVRLLFPTHQFTGYVLDYQLAFAVLFIPTAITFHLGPRFSELSAANQHAAITHLEAKAQRLTFLFGVAAAFGIYAYAWVTKVPVTPWYWLLVAGFLVHGAYLVVSSRIQAHMQFHASSAISILGAIFFTAALVIAGLLRSVEIAYGAWLVHGLAELTLARFIGRSNRALPIIANDYE